MDSGDWGQGEYLINLERGGVAGAYGLFLAAIQS